MDNFQARVKDGAIKFDLVYEREEFKNYLLSNDGDYLEITGRKKGDQKRTSSQNRGMHKYHQDIARMLNDSGISVPVFLEGLEVDFTPEMIKNIWRKIGKKKFNRIKTSEWNKNQVTEAYDEFNRHTTLHGIHLPFPSKEMQGKALDEAIEYEENTLEENNWK